MISRAFAALRRTDVPTAVPVPADAKLAAVAVIFREYRNRSEVLVIQRAQRTGDPWSGHLAFPGGRHDPGDPSLLATAVREVREEIGLSLRHEHLLSAQPQLAAPQLRSGQLLVAPFAFEIGGDPELTLAPGEVASAFWVDLEPLLSGARDTHYELQRDKQRMRFPGFVIGEHVLWGMSYRMLQPILAALSNERPRTEPLGAEPSAGADVAVDSNRD